MGNLYISIHADQSARLSSLSGVRMREDTLYSNHHGEGKKGIRKRAEKAINQLQDILRKVLDTEEVVLYVARCQAPVSAFEQLTMGWYAYYVSSTVLVFTNRRILHFLVKREGGWKKVLRAVNWGDVEEAKVKGWFSPALQLKYRNGKKETYWHLRRDDAKKIKVVIGAVFSAGAGETRGSIYGFALPWLPRCTNAAGLSVRHVRPQVQG